MRLVVLRHAKAARPLGVRDHERPLAERGRRDSSAAGLWIGEHAGVPEVALVSTALRTRQTWDGVRATLLPEPALRLEPAVYEAHPDTLLEVVTSAPAARTVLLVGHNPGCEELVELLTGTTEPAAKAARDAAGAFPTSAVAVLDADLDWPQWAPGVATLTGFAIPRA